MLQNLILNILYNVHLRNSSRITFMTNKITVIIVDKSYNSLKLYYYQISKQTEISLSFTYTLLVLSKSLNERAKVDLKNGRHKTNLHTEMDRKVLY